MMLRSLVDEVVRRRLWPIPVVALLVVIAAPLLFMKSAPAGAPAATEAPPAAAPGQLPNSAEKLVTTSDRAVVPHKRSTRKRQDPFAPPTSAVVKETASATGAAKASGSTATSPPQSGVIKNADGSTTTITTTKKKSGKTSTATKPAPETTPAPETVNVAESLPVVNVRFAPRADSKVRRNVPRLQTFRAGGKVAAMFVKYSPARDKAVFAIAPSTQVTGDVKCRRKEGVCRYVDIPAGKHVRLKLRAEDGSVVSRRLDVVSIKHVPAPDATTTSEEAPAEAPRATPLTEAKCLLKKLLALPSILIPSIAVDTCE